MSTLTEKEFLLINDIVREIHAAGNVREMGGNIFDFDKKTYSLSFGLVYCDDSSESYVCQCNG